MKKIALLIVLSLVCFASCKKTVESEKRSWDVNLREANELKFEYPSFANLITDQIKIAEPAMNEALAIGDEKLKLQKMTDANGLLNPAFIRNLKEIKSLKYSIKTKSTELRGLKLNFNEISTANRVISEAERSSYDSDSKLRATVNNKIEADSLTGFVLSDIKSYVTLMDKMISNVKDRESAEKKKIEQVAADKAVTLKQQTEAAQPIKCSYCGELNIAGSTKCKSCGAPLSRK